MRKYSTEMGKYSTHILWFLDFHANVLTPRDQCGTAAPFLHPFDSHAPLTPFSRLSPPSDGLCAISPRCRHFELQGYCTTCDAMPQTQHRFETVPEHSSFSRRQSRYEATSSSIGIRPPSLAFPPLVRPLRSPPKPSPPFPTCSSPRTTIEPCPGITLPVQLPLPRASLGRNRVNDTASGTTIEQSTRPTAAHTAVAPVPRLAPHTPPPPLPPRGPPRRTSYPSAPPLPA